MLEIKNKLIERRMFVFNVPFWVGIFIGGTIGFFISCLMSSASSADDKKLERR